MAGSDMSGSALLKRDKRSVATYFRGENTKRTNLQKFQNFLEHLLGPQRPIDDFETLDWCKWMIAGGTTFDDFAKTVRQYDNAITCGLVWTANFVAYRCRTCGISPCMSLCSDCFQAGNHEGHDYNMFRSQAGGACDCGDVSVMNQAGFCPRHGPDRHRHTMHMPSDVLANAEAMMPQVFLRLLYHLRDNSKPEMRNSYSVTMEDAEQFLSFLQSLSDMGAAMRRVMANTLTNAQEYKKLTVDKSANNPYSSESQKNYQQARDTMPFPSTFNKYQNKKGLNQQLTHSTLLDELVFWMVKYEFPQKVVTLLLSMLPVDSYKEAFTRAFVQHYSRISLVLVQALDRLTVANRVVHISVQLFSNEGLASKMVRDSNLLYVLILSLTHMVEEIRTGSTLEDPDPANNFHNVADCSNEVMKSHCYWPIISDLINLLTHSTVAYRFLLDTKLVTMWMELLSYLQGMNLNQRELSQHVEFEPDSYYAAFSAELEISASPMWSLLVHCKSRSSSSYSLRMIAAAQVALQDWFLAINCQENMKPNPYQLTFHLPLHRYLAMFMMQAVLHQGVALTDIMPEDSLVKKIMIHVLQIQVCLAQIYAGMWVRNGIQIKGQAMTYVQCHFCYSMADADIFMLQVCASQLDPDYFVNTILERFNIVEWLSFSPQSGPGRGSLSPEHEIAMVEGALSLLVTLLGIRTYLGMGDKELVRLEMASLLCMNDRQHSQLMDLMPEKSGVSGHGKELFEPTLKKIAEYKAPVFAAGGGMQQGTYVPKGEVWEKDYDPVHVSLRAIYRKDFQSSMDRYTEYVRQSGKYKGKSSPWPPFHSPGQVNPAFKGLFHILNSRSMHAFLFTVLYKAVQKDSNIPESVLYYCVHLLDLCVTYSPTHPSRKSMSQASSVMDGKYHRWFPTSDIKQNACETISEVNYLTRGTSQREQLDPCTVSVDMDTSSLEEMFQLAPSAATSMGGPITAAQIGLPAIISSSGTAACITAANHASTAHAVKPRYESRGVSTEQLHSSRVAINENLLSLLLKLHSKLSGKAASYVPVSVTKREATKSSIGDGVHFVGKLLDRFCELSTDCGRIVHDTYRALAPVNRDKEKKQQDKGLDKEAKRRKAFERQQKLMAEFASKQKAFMEQTMEDDIQAEEESKKTTAEEDFLKMEEKTYDCVICGQTTPSTGDRPVGLVVFLQASSVLGHRLQTDHAREMAQEEARQTRLPSCAEFQKKRLETLLKHFEEPSCHMSVNVGWEGGMYVQTCGHYLHLDCHSSYLQSLNSTSPSDNLSVAKGEYWCPLCRQMSNSVVPIVPEENHFALVKPVSRDPETMVRDLADMMVTRSITPGSSNLTRVMANVMDDLISATHSIFKIFSHSQTSESVLLFVCSVARTNLEIELLQRGGSLDKAQSTSFTKKNCLLPLLHVLSLHSKILTKGPYTDLWALITGVTLSEESTCISVYHKEVPLLLKDVTSLLIQIILTLPATIKQEHYDFLVGMLFNVVYVQALAVMSCKFTSEEREAWRKKGQHVPSETMEGMLSHIVTRLSLSRLFDDIDKEYNVPAICQSVWSPQSVEDSLQDFCLPFLRMSALLKQHIFGLDLSPVQGQTEFQFLSSFLSLRPDKVPATSREITTSSCVHWAVQEPLKLTRAWCTDLLNFISIKPTEGKNLLTKQPTWYPPRLVSLPSQYYQIFQTYRSKQCGVCNKVPRDPTLCLVCGLFLCFRDSCCRENMMYECVRHSITCGGGTGIFLLVNSSVIVVIRGPRATLWGSIFLDEHGEEDRDLKRGKPLYLSQERYRLLHEQWLSHSFDHVSKKWIWHRDRL